MGTENRDRPVIFGFRRRRFFHGQPLLFADVCCAPGDIQAKYSDTGNSLVRSDNRRYGDMVVTRVASTANSVRKNDRQRRPCVHRTGACDQWLRFVRCFLDPKIRSEKWRKSVFRENAPWTSTRLRYVRVVGHVKSFRRPASRFCRTYRRHHFPGFLECSSEHATFKRGSDVE